MTEYVGVGPRESKTAGTKLWWAGDVTGVSIATPPSVHLHSHAHFTHTQ